jgi:ArsR family transcriptional regulator
MSFTRRRPHDIGLEPPRGIRIIGAPVDLVGIYQCFSDRTRLRILHLLCEGPLCVCHFQELLNEPQVKISKHLGYLRTRGLVQASREGSWMIYRLPAKPPAELAANLACLQACARADSVFRRDLAKFRAVAAEFAQTSPVCASKPRRAPAAKRSAVLQPALGKGRDQRARAPGPG